MRANSQRVEPAKSRRVTPPAPSYMNDDQVASYLAGLRSNRVARPGGARLPSPNIHHPPNAGQARSTHGHVSSPHDTKPREHHNSELMTKPPSASGASVSSRYSNGTLGQDCCSTMGPGPSPAPLRPSEVVPTATYMESGHRWMEKEETHSLRDAMEVMDMRERKSQVQSQDEDDQRLYNAALNEAAELVWQHQHPGQARKPDEPYRYRPHLRKNSYAHARTASAMSGLSNKSSSRSASGSSTDSNGTIHGRGSRNQVTRHISNGNNGRDGSVKTNISGKFERPFESDQIWEEPEIAIQGTGSGRASPEKLASKPPNPLNRVRFEPLSIEEKAVHRIDIHRNPPTQARNPMYIANRQSSSGPFAKSSESIGADNLELRSDDIRQATSMRRKDRSARLPEPTAVSDVPGRPIVSFDQHWKAPDHDFDNTNNGSRLPSRPQSMNIPTICVGNENEPPTRSDALPRPPVPIICVEGDADDARSPDARVDVPTVLISDAAEQQISSLPRLPKSVRGSARPLPNPSGTSIKGNTTPKPKGHWSPAGGPPSKISATCHECAHPIQGRFVALAGCSERFHPKCFRCFTCGTSLEAMEISPEPQKLREERLSRILQRANGEVLEESPGETMAEDGDERLRFFCHLDWHELFAPKCKHCKTPILGEHVVALGQHWHYGHFFCAECGDPFEHGMTHIEKDGYAWCIKCQTKRTERRAPKCMQCNIAVIGQYIEALGGEWHEHCFRCAECRGGFDDGQIFPKEIPEGLVVLCTACRMTELKS